MERQEPEEKLNTEILKNMLVKHEALRLSVYQDSLGYWTIGVGRLVDGRKGGGISKDEAMYLLDNDIKKVEADLDSHLSWWRNLDETRQLVIADMCFNMGIGNLLEFKKALKAMQEGRYLDAGNEMKDSRWATQVGQRATHLIGMMRGEE